VRGTLAKLLSDGYANPNLPTASLHKDLLLIQQSTQAGPGDGGPGWAGGGAGAGD
jgi:hypothetical protein